MMLLLKPGIPFIHNQYTKTAIIPEEPEENIVYPILKKVSIAVPEVNDNSNIFNDFNHS
jgi:hypothetical protein